MQPPTPTQPDPNVAVTVADLPEYDSSIVALAERHGISYADAQALYDAASGDVFLIGEVLDRLRRRGRFSISTALTMIQNAPTMTTNDFPNAQVWRCWFCGTVIMQMRDAKGTYRHICKCNKKNVLTIP